MKNVKEMAKDRKFMKQINKDLIDFGFIEKPKKKNNKNIIIFCCIIAVVFITTVLLFAGGCSSKSTGGTISSNIVYEAGDSTPAFLDVTFTKRLQNKIKDGEIDLYGLNLTHSIEGGEAYITASSKESEDTIDKIRIIKKEYIKYSEDYLNTYFADGYEPSEDGYYQYTIDLA